jgi:hypothetical protein
VARLHYRGGHKSRLCHIRGSRALEAGATLHSLDGDPVRVLDCAMADGKAEALVVAPKHESRIFNILHDEYEIISGYDP